ncbi:TniQ family protein [Pseudomonas antarctica]|uniref:TniQ family protein n=1 Tax=Pseudomonas antarctica TaxID=219572 RepID=UPI00387AC334
MAFRGLPVPGNDETLSSWLFRCSVNPHVITTHRLQSTDRPVRWWDGLELKSADPDIDFSSVICRFGLDCAHINLETLEQFFAFRSGTLVEWKYRRFFCPDCLAEDVVKGQLPKWQKSWCTEQSSCCLIHGRILEALIDASHYSKAWDAFVQCCNTNPSRINMPLSVLSRFRSTTRAKIIQFINRLSVEERNIFVNIFNKLYSIFLQAPYKGGRGGAARIHFQSERGARFADPLSLEHSFIIGPSTADPSSRFGSMILAASLVGIVSESRYSMFVRVWELANPSSLLPRDLHLVAAFPHVDRIGYQVLKKYLGYVPKTFFPVLERHLLLQEKRYAREGVFDGYTFGILNID